MSPSEDNTEVIERLSALRLEANLRAKSLTASFAAIVDAANDVATDDEHDPEGHTIAWERQQLAALAADAEATIAAVDAAEERLGEGRYGLCTSCGSPISAARLDALPATATCLNCA